MSKKIYADPKAQVKALKARWRKRVKEAVTAAGFSSAEKLLTALAQGKIRIVPVDNPPNQ